MTSAAIQQTTPIINTKVSLRTYSVAVVKFMHEEEENVKTLQIIVSSSPLAPHFAHKISAGESSSNPSHHSTRLALPKAT